jgi:hypothetical protein
MSRKMPKAGFYIRPPVIGIDIHKNQFIIGGSIVYTTGIRGGGGHKYIRFDLDGDRSVPNNINMWPSLLWSCVPGKKERSNLIYADTLDKAVKIYNSGIILRYINYGEYKMEKLSTNNDPIKII